MNTVKITEANFEKEVIQSEKPVLVDFWASWCGPCMMQGPVMDELAEERDDIKVGKINIDEEQALAVKFGVSSIPTLMLFRDGKEAGTLVGLRSGEQIISAFGL